MTNRPLIVELIGTPESGKTSTGLLLEKILSQSGVRTRLFSEAASTAPLPRDLRLSYRFNLWTLGCQLQNLIEAECSTHQVVILDRGPTDSLCWFRYFHAQGQISELAFDQIRGFLESPELIERIDLTYLLHCSAREAVSRKGSEGQIVNPSILPLLIGAYEALDHPRIVSIDTELYAKREIADMIVAEIMEKNRNIQDVGEN